MSQLNPPVVAAAPRAPRAASRRSAGYVGTLVAACAATFVAQLANAIPGALNGTFQSYYNTQGSQLTWITAAFMIPVVVFELTFGVLGDLWGRKKLSFIGAALLVLGGLVTIFASNVDIMFVGAALDGFGAGILFPSSLASVAAVTHTPADRARAIAIWAGFLSLGASVSPIIAGSFGAAGWWQGAYLVVALAAVLAFALNFRSAETSAPEGRRLDWAGQVTFAIGLLALLWALVQGSEWGYGTPAIVVGFVAGVVLLVAFLFIERRSASPLLHLDLFKIRAFSVASIVAVIGMFAFLGFNFSSSMWLGTVQHQNALDIGILFMFSQGPSFVLIPVIGPLLHRVKPQWLLSVGFALIAVGAYIAATYDVHDFNWVKFLVPCSFVGVGWALTVASISAVAINTVPLHFAGMGSATTNLLRDLGFTLGPVVGGSIALSVANSRLIPGLEALHLPASAAGPVLGIARQGGAVAINSIPTLPDAVHAVALTVLGSGFNIAYLVCAVAATVAALLTLFGLLGTASSQPHGDELVDLAHEPAV